MIKYIPLPKKLAVGMRVACPKCEPDPAVYEVFRVDGDRVWLRNSFGIALHGNLPRDALAEFDYCLVVEGAAAEIPLPVQPEDINRVDEKYSLRGHESIDARFGTDWNQPDERMSP